MNITQCQNCGHETFIIYDNRVSKCSACGKTWGIAGSLVNQDDKYVCILNYQDFERIIFCRDFRDVLEIEFDMPKFMCREMTVGDIARTGLPKIIKFILDHRKSDFNKKILHYNSEENYEQIN